jgi:hypothetical protein
VAHNLESLGLLYQEQGQYGKAEELYVRSISILEEAADKPEQRRMVKTLELYGALLRASGRESEAVAMEARAQVMRDSAESDGNR